MVTLTTQQELELHNLRLAFRENLPKRIQAIEAALDEVISSHGVDSERIEVLFHLAHRLCGSAGIYGLDSVHRAAAALEGAAELMQRTPAESASSQLEGLGRLVQALRRASTDAPSATAMPPRKAPGTKQKSRPRSPRRASR